MLSKQDALKKIDELKNYIDSLEKVEKEEGKWPTKEELVHLLRSDVKKFNRIVRPMAEGGLREILPKIDGLLDLRGADLRNADLIEANLYQANLSNSNMSNTNLIEADLSNADLSSANLYEADLSSANLYEADLSSANLRNADLIEADLRNANLIEANLRNANLYGADLYSAKFYGKGGSVFLKKEQVPVFLKALGFAIED